jgi:hypothetical protein
MKPYLVKKKVIDKPLLNLLVLTKNKRLGLWILLLLLTSAILLFPVHFRFEYHAIESLYIFGNKLLLFGALHCIWLVILMLLLFTRNNEWQRVALVSIFALVFVGFWIINTPYGGWADAIVNMGHVKYLGQTGRIAVDNPVLAYFQFPGLHLTGLSLSQISGLDIFKTSVLFLLFSRILFAVLLYVLFAKSLKNPHLASLAVLLLLQGALMLSRNAFHPSFMAILFFTILLIMLLPARGGGALGITVAATSIMLISFAALTVTYLPIPTFFIFVLVGIYVLQKLSGETLVSSSIIILCLVVVLAWEMYWATRMFSDIAGQARFFVASFTNPVERFLPTVETITTSLGESVPLWARLARVFWLAFIFVFGAILGIRNLFRSRKLDSIETMETGGLWGVLTLSIIVILAFPAGIQQSRVLLYAPFFTIPIVVRFLSGFSHQDELFQSTRFGQSLANAWGWFTTHIFTLLLILFFILSFPTFLLYNNSVSTMAVYRYELAAGEFVEASCGTKPLRFFSDIITVYTNAYYVPDANLSHPPQPWEIADEEELWLDINRLVDMFGNSEGDAIFVLTERFTQPYRSISVIERTDLRWIEFVNRLSRNDKIYDNGHTQIYTNPPAK